MECVDDEDNIMIINDFKIKWFNLLSRVDASPTVDEMVLSSLNSIANILTSNRCLENEYDLLFQYALKLNIFECIFRWNFVFAGADLEAFKLKELQFYDTLIAGNGNSYLRHPEFALPVLATLHYCSIRSCLAVERVLLRTLNSICAALCSQHLESQHNSPPDYGNSISSENDKLTYFRRLCLGLLDSTEVNGYRSAFDPEGANHSGPSSVEPTTASSFRLNEYVDWSMSAESKSNDPPVRASSESNIHEKTPSIDSIFDLLVPFVFREGELGWQARDALLLVSTYSLRDEGFSYAVAHYSSVCPVLATGLATLYAELPRRLVDNNQPASWPTLMQTLEEYEQSSPKFSEYYDALEFCQSILEVSHPLIQSSLLHYIHSGFFVSVLGFSLTKPSVEDVITATVYLKQLILHTTKSALLPILLRFLLTRMPEEVGTHKTHPELQKQESGHTGSVYGSNSTLSDQGSAGLEDRTGTQTANLGPTYMDLLISRLQYCNTLLGVATLSLFNTLLGLHCEDVMLYLIFRYLVPFRDSLLALGWSWPEHSCYAQAAGEFLDLIAAYDDIPKSNHVQPSPSFVADESKLHPLHESVAELNLDDEPELNGIDDEWSSVNQVKPENMNSINGSLYIVKHSSSAPKSTPCTMEALMPVHSEFILAPASNGTTSEHLQQNGGTMISTNHSLNTTHEPHQRTYLTPDDWFNYTCWARDAIRSRTYACTDWRLTYDASHPSASQLVGIEDRFNSTLYSSEEEAEQQYHGCENLGSTPVINRKFKTAHSRFDCFTIKHPTVEQMREEAGEKTAQALRMAVCKLDIDTELDLDGSSNEILPQVTEQPPERQSKQQEFNGRHSTVDSTQVEGIVTVNLPQTGTAEPGTDTEAAEYSDSGIDVTRSLPKSNSDYPLRQSPLMKNGHDPQQIKSWYCLSYLDGNFLDSTIDDSEQSDRRNGQKDKFQRSLIRQRSMSETKSRTNRKAQAASSGSQSEDLDRFIDCLQKISSPTTNSEEGSHRHSFDLENYFASSQGDAIPSTDAHSPCSKLPETAEQNDKHCNEIALSQVVDRSGPVCIRKARPKSLVYTVDNYQKITNGNGMHAESTRNLHSSSLPDQDNHECFVRPSSVHSLCLYVQAMPFEPVCDTIGSSSTQYLNTLLRRHSIGSQTRSVDKVLPKRRTSTKSESGVYTQAPFPTLGPFLSTILSRLESMPHNCFYANLYLTNLLSNLAAYSIPLLRAVLLHTPRPRAEDDQVLGDSAQSRLKALQETYNQLPYAILSTVRKQLDMFVIQYASYSPLRSELTFMDLVADAKQYFRSATDSTRSSTEASGLPNGYWESDLVTNPDSRQHRSFFRRFFRLSSRKSKSKKSKNAQKDTNVSATRNSIVKETNMNRLSSSFNNEECSSRFLWLPDSNMDELSLASNTEKKRSRRSGRKQSKAKSQKDTTVSWPVTKSMVLCAVVYEEFCKELAALCVEHSLHS